MANEETFNRAEFAEEFNLQQSNLRLIKFTLYRDLFPWFGPAMLNAGYEMGQPEPLTVREVWKRGHAAWTNATKMRPLNTNSDWQGAANAADWRGQTGDFNSLRESIFEWAYGMVASAPAAPVKQEAWTGEVATRKQWVRRFHKGESTFDRWIEKNKITHRKHGESYEIHPESVRLFFPNK